MITGLEQFKYYGEYVKGWAERDKSAGRSKVESDFRGQNKFRYQPFQGSPWSFLQSVIPYAIFDKVPFFVGWMVPQELSI